ncbi:MAG: hypothetical protein ABF624_01620 [Liquorilactobacillus ghanensis]|uniref:hypothetical protein n=1 Tax=Liquorilactobacillus ghanensis TaxID=399370 RepID=UPI0039E879A1
MIYPQTAASEVIYLDLTVKQIATIIGWYEELAMQESGGMIVDQEETKLANLLNQKANSLIVFQSTEEVSSNQY